MTEEAAALAEAPCPTNHDTLRRNAYPGAPMSVNARFPVRCVDCGRALDPATVVACVIRWIMEDRAAIAALEERLAAIESVLTKGVA